MKIIHLEKNNGRINVYFCSLKVFSYKKKTEYDRIYAGRYNIKNETAAREFLMAQFKHFLNEDLNLDDPQTFNEKLQWLKLYYHNPLVTKCADKVEVRKYIEENAGSQYLVPLIGVYDKFEDIDFETLPKKFALKINWGSGQNIICKDKKLLDIKKIKKKISKWMQPESNHYFNHLEWCYKDIKPKIVIENFIEAKDDLIDYKILCYNGEPKNLFVCSERTTSLKVTFFDLNWKRLPFSRKYPVSDKLIEKPKKLEEMLNVAKKLAKDFPFVRVDFFEVDGKLYVGELTFFPGAGIEKFSSPEWDLKLGEYIKLPHKMPWC